MELKSFKPSLETIKGWGKIELPEYAIVVSGTTPRFVAGTKQKEGRVTGLDSLRCFDDVVAHLSGDGQPASIHVHESYILLSTDKVHPGEADVVYPATKKKGKAQRSKRTK